MKLWSHEKRKKQKAETRHMEFCPVVFTHHGKNYSAFLVDISPQGAKLRAADHNEEPPLSENAPITLNIKTPYGTGVCEGAVKWADRQENGYRWGIQFVKRSTDPSDPIQCLIESSIA